MVILFKKRAARKHGKELLRHANHLRNMRGDILSPELLARLEGSEKRVSEAMRQGVLSAMESANDHLGADVNAMSGPYANSALREHLEVFIVAIAVAMAFRAYFIQPFKIPTGSMMPTLNGIYSRHQNGPGTLDVMPFKLLKFAVTGEWYTERRVERSGVYAGGQPMRHPTDPSASQILISGVPHKIQSDVLTRNRTTGELNIRAGQSLKKGDLLWSGIVTRGDHLFVNKVIWNFRKPRRGEVMVFTTKGIHELENSGGFPQDKEGNPLSTHYIKRMVGLPGETVAIRSPSLVVNGRTIDDPRERAKRAYPDATYSAYVTEQPMANGYFASRAGRIKLQDAEYLAFGDNTYNSKDSRYWGTVPARNLVGPAAIVYWPLSRRWGLVR